MRVPRLWAALIVVLVTGVGCGPSFDSAEQLAERIGCDAILEGSSDETTIGCLMDDRVETLYLSAYDDADELDEAIEYLRGLPKDGTADAFFIYGDNWTIDCFTKSVCEDIAEEVDGTLEQRK